jgi:predicted DCC family thiol-disulfide oxidoreductase YuxK
VTATSTALVARSAERTRAPGGTRLVILFDGNCRFCTQSAKTLARRVGPARAVATNFQEDGVLASYPGVTYEACMQRMHVIDPEGRVYAGAGAVARLFRTIPIVGILAYLYYVPGVRQLSEIAYAFIAKNRYKLFGKTQACEPGGTCHLH